MTPFPGQMTPAIRRWAAQNRFSPELVARWATYLPNPEDVLRGLLRPVPKYARLNPLRGDPKETVARLEKRGFKLERVPFSKDGVELRMGEAHRVVEEPFSLASTPEYLLGKLYVMDLASLSAPLALDAKPNERVLDMCAAPGGKTIVVCQRADDKVLMLAADTNRERCGSLIANLTRCHVRNAAVVNVSGQDLPAKGLAGTADKVLLDAPCTGEGVIPKDENRRRGHLEEFARCAAEQRHLLDAAWRLLKPGGRLVYSTCTFAPEENEFALVAAAKLGFEPEALPFDAVGGVPLAPAIPEMEGHDLAPASRARRLYPHLHASMGFFVASLRKPEVT